MTVQLEEGKYYRTRDGRKVGPLEKREWAGDTTFFFDKSKSVTAQNWYPHEAYIDQQTGMLDLVAEWASDLIYSEGDTAPIAAASPRFAGALAFQAKEEAGSKFDAGKARLDLIAPEFLIGTAEILDFGAKKYGERNWEAGMSWSRPFAALMRHMWAWWSGEKLDAETGKSHLWHAACCLMFLMAFEARGTGNDDRPPISG